MVAFKAHFDGKVIVPDEPVDLRRGQALIVQIQPVAADTSKQEGDAWSVLNSLAGSVEGPADWSVEHDHYLYGTPKRNTK